MPGMPGGDPSQQQPGQDAQQPYAGRMGHAGDQPTDNAQQAAGKLQAFTKQQQGGDEDDDDDAGAGGVEPDTLKRLRDNDWTESVHASQRDSDLRKSIATLFIHELDV